MVCTKVVIIKDGQVIAKDNPENLTAQKGYVEILARAPKEEFTAYLKNIPEVKEVEAKMEDNFIRAYIHFDPQYEIRPKLTQGIVQSGWELLELRPRRKSLEEVFVQLVTKEAS
ncbi:MAG: hypothetical protein KCCBMMGE_00328 [Candidatus Methanoperedenaceae archaeon GB37]|nr:hypothetical protein DMNBHIDG_01052 [Candidatus Methanoperedenaceae archaeon GB37]CAD7775593.1 MAG: hypothetical protein KCCBMMGE_00328 [Candidatus Methanoperedenaceae archaeon GB37]